MSNKILVSSSPHIKDNSSTFKLMRDVIISLMPALLMSGYIFGASAIILVLVTVISCVGFEYGFNIIVKKDQTIGDLSAVVTGVLLAFNLPANLPIWMAIIGSFVSIIIIKMLFGGLGKNFANPAIVGRIVLMVSFSGFMTDYPNAFFYNSTKEIVATATPLANINEAWSNDSFVKLPELMDLLLGFRGGVLGETAGLALIIGGIYLVVRKVISPIIPLSFIGTVYVLTFLVDAYPTQQILTGGLLLGAIFMATDYVTGPLSKKGKLVFGIACGLITVIIRLYGGYTEGVSFAILIMNILTPYIDKYTRNKPLGGVYNV
ncbi:MAG: RnfABCDGE type electron transport complex subunit D [Oscillospiraceae bacterium]